MDKPNARRNGWELLRNEYPYTHFMFRVRADWLRWPDGVERSFTYLEAGPAVLIIPLTTAGELVLIREFRYTIDDWVWELPGGCSYDFEGDDLAELARRELWEEVGGTAEHFHFLGHVHGVSGLLSQEFHVYLAAGVRLAPINHPEATEAIEVHTLPISQALEIIRGEATDALDGYIVLRYEPWLRTIAVQAAAGELPDDLTPPLPRTQGIFHGQT